MTKPLRFDPAKVTYARRLIRTGRKRKDGTRFDNKSGPYWYANEMVNGMFKTYYIGKYLPEECKPYVPESDYISNPSPNKRGAQPVRLRGASDSILQALDNGEQVVIDLNQIAKDCNAYVDRIAPNKYVFYRDPK